MTASTRRVKRIGGGEELVFLDPLEASEKPVSIEHGNRRLDEDGVLRSVRVPGRFLGRVFVFAEVGSSPRLC